MAAVAIRQACGASAAAQQQALLTLRMQDQGLGAVGRAVRHLGGVAAAAQAMSLTGLDQANFGKDLLEVIGHGWAHVARMKSGKV